MAARCSPDCTQCHVNGSEELPVPANLLSVATPRDFITNSPPETAACSACHSDKSSASHALANTTQLGEACDVCHASDAEFSVNKCMHDRSAVDGCQCRRRG